MITKKEQLGQKSDKLSDSQSSSLFSSAQVRSGFSLAWLMFSPNMIVSRKNLHFCVQPHSEAFHMKAKCFGVISGMF